MRRVALLLLVAIGCTKAPTQLIVAIDSDFNVPAELAAIDARAASEDGTTGDQHRFDLRETALPFSFGVAADEDPNGAVLIEILGRDPQDGELVARRVVTHFIESRSLLLPIFLSRACTQASCGDPEMIDPATLEDVEPGKELEGIRRDAGVVDRPDANGPDANMSGDGGPPEDAALPCDPPAHDGDPCGAGEMRCCRGMCLDTASETSACGPSCSDCGSNSTCTQGQCGCVEPFDDCDREIGCEADLTSDSDNCDQCMHACAMGTSCIDRSCAACSSALDCPVDMLPCTDAPQCSSGECSQPLFPNYCLIGGACFDEGDVNPTDPCLHCVSATSSIAWSVFPGNTCNDGLYCTVTDTCDARGHCIGEGVRCPPDSIACTTESCNESDASCESALQSGYCEIQNVCYTTGTHQPSNDCMGCDPSTNLYDWTPRTGAMCNDGLFCTDTDSCDATGTCVGTGNPCGATTPCSTDVCEETGTCTTLVLADFCLILSNNTCVPAGTTDPNSACRTCQPGINPFNYSAVADNMVACGVNQMCCGGLCTAVLNGACGMCGVTCPMNACMCGGTGDPFSCSCN